MHFYCTRCGERAESYYCVHHIGMLAKMTDAEATRIRARYALGKLHNPDHDTTSYRDGNAD